AGQVQAVLGLSGRRVACSVDTASRQTVDLFSLSERGRPVRTLSLDSAGQSVQALAAVEGETDALIGSTAAAGSIALWNMRTGQLLRRISLGLYNPGTVCLRGYSHHVRLSVLLVCRWTLCKS
uniref:Partner and localiser of BRCA2 WD40 domain-containing protein n=1 Tax=Lepisosteus oculatus TaxID=7918 RepID=W5MEE1_LEPOC